MESTDKLAVLIDADNAQPSIVDGLMIEIANFGTASVKGIYGDWTAPKLKGWKEVLYTSVKRRKSNRIAQRSTLTFKTHHEGNLLTAYLVQTACANKISIAPDAISWAI